MSISAETIQEILKGILVVLCLIHWMMGAAKLAPASATTGAANDTLPGTLLVISGLWGLIVLLAI